MISKLAFFYNLFLTSAVLAAPSSQLESRLTRGLENRLSHNFNRAESPADAASNVTQNENSAGAILSKPRGTFANVTGTFVVPTLSGKDGAASAWVGIDGDSCQSALLQTGINFMISDGKVSYDPWYEWIPAPTNSFPSSMSINAGDTITLTVAAYSTTNGIVIIENKTNNQTITQKVNSTHALCGQDADWIVEDFQENGKRVPFVDFGSVTFTNASAIGPSGKIYTPSGAPISILDIAQNGSVVATTSISGDEVIIKRRV